MVIRPYMVFFERFMILVYRLQSGEIGIVLPVGKRIYYYVRDKRVVILWALKLGLTGFLRA